MATQPVQGESPARQVSELERLYAAWRFAKAAWELDQYAPDHFGDDLPDELDKKHCNATCDALNAFLLHPAENIGDLSRKLRVFCEEQIAEGWTKASVIAEQMAQDARSIFLQGDRA